ncbi:MAG TPA: cytochrome c [Myxococcota bacterium]|nr:cytochrome c [Myxococcota bacterium]HRY95818.1 cytochrome c [Myxococcota bacterium]HSA22750.1 cytochrome c [Myxococcota bacterium]
MPKIVALVACALCAVCLAACVPGPKMNYTAAQVKDIDDIHELMRYAYAETKGIWGLEGQEALAEPDYALLVKVGEELEAVGTVLGDKLGAERAEGFRVISRALAAEGGKMRDAAKGQDAAGAKAAIKAIGESCDACHKQFK